MTKVNITKNNQGDIVEIVCDGHTGYGVAGEDIVCAALSSIVQTAVLGLFSVAEINLEFKRNEKQGYLFMRLPNDITEEQNQKAQIILKTVLLGINDLYEGYSDFIELEVK